ncbi:MAG: amidohydrolase family protein [Pseudomonadota bacterium]|nr:amidohydrolase family protein [Pseudomonadota bacterium]
MTHDLVIRNGQIVDGTGNPSYEGDVAVDGDTITALGTVTKKSAREIEADGAAVTPGFVDLHTHLDAQIGWDPSLTPACWHGVTTVLMGNCGVTFAPVRGGDKEFLAEMMESVEDIPREAILSGLPWDWNSYGEYLDSIEKMNPAINMVGLVGHAAARFYVMGERAVDEQPTDDEVQQIADLIGESVQDGAAGFSTNRIEAHRLPDGRCMPGTFASEEELVAISKATGAHGGMLQSVINSGKDQLPGEMNLMRKQLEAAGTRFLFSAPWEVGENGMSAYQPAIEDMQKSGLNIYGTTQPRPAAFLSGLKTLILFGVRMKDAVNWRSLRNLPVEERLAAIQDIDFRGKLIEEAKRMEPADSIFQTLGAPGFSIPPARSFWMGNGEQPEYPTGEDNSLGGLARAAGEHPGETWLRLMLESEGEGLFHVRFVNQDMSVLPDYMRADWVVPGVGDAGAHISMISDVGWASFLLSYWHRERGEYSLEEAIHMLTAKQAKVLDLKDRGTLRVGLKADINVIDINRVGERHAQRVYDFPHGAPRLLQRAAGYRNTIVNGRVILENDELTGERGGRVLRNRGGKLS